MTHVEPHPVYVTSFFITNNVNFIEIVAYKQTDRPNRTNLKSTIECCAITCFYCIIITSSLIMTHVETHPVFIASAERVGYRSCLCRFSSTFEPSNNSTFL
nr:Caab116 [Calliteara abietis nucleopolyhedrovirus]